MMAIDGALKLFIQQNPESAGARIARVALLTGNPRGGAPDPSEVRNLIDGRNFRDWHNPEAKAAIAGYLISCGFNIPGWLMEQARRESPNERHR